jgi:hypothetical protein
MVIILKKINKNYLICDKNKTTYPLIIKQILKIHYKMIPKLVEASVDNLFEIVINCYKLNLVYIPELKMIYNKL